MNADDDDRTRIRPAAEGGRSQQPVSAGPATSASRPSPRLIDSGNELGVGTQIAEFEITALLGEGGFGIVYLAKDHSLQRTVALKEYMPSALAARSDGSGVQVKSDRHRETFDAGLKSFVNEARLLAQFDHPALVKVYRFWEANGTAYMVMPYYQGRTLKEMLADMREPPDESWLRALLTPLTQALSVLHAHQCFHRDIAPDNVMMLGGSQHRPLLLDFGAARRVIGDMTQALTVILKPGYAPIEQYAEIPGMKQGAWTDVYALAAVVYFAIRGKTPPPAVGRLLNDSYEPLVEAAAGVYSQQFLAAIDRALAVRPEDRTQSIAALGADLGLGQARFDIYSTRPLPPGLGDSPVAASSDAPEPAVMATPKPSAEPARSVLPWIAGGALGLAALAFGAFQWLAADSPSDSPRTSGPPAPAIQSTLPVPVESTPTPATVRAPAPPVFDVAEQFAQVVRTATPGFTVQAAADKSSLQIGRDQLSFTIRSEREGFLYVFAHGADDTLLQLYPNTESGSLRMRPGEAVSLPKRPIVFEVTEPPGEGHLLVMVSSRQREFGALEPRPEGAFRTFPTGAEAARLAQAHTGSGALLAGRAVCPSGQACVDEYGAAVVRVDVIR